MSAIQTQDAPDPLTAYVDQVRAPSPDTSGQRSVRRAPPRVVFPDWAFI